MKLFTIKRLKAQPGAAPAMPKGYQLWLVVCLVVLVGSLLMLAISAGAAFVYYSDAAVPLWLTVLGVLAGMGVAVGFGGLFLLLVLAGWRSFREEKATTRDAE